MLANDNIPDGTRGRGRGRVSRFIDTPTWLCYRPLLCECKELCRLAV